MFLTVICAFFSVWGEGGAAADSRRAVQGKGGQTRQGTRLSDGIIPLFLFGSTFLFLYMHVCMRWIREYGVY